MSLRLGLHVDAGMEMEERALTGGVTSPVFTSMRDDPVVELRPYRHAAPFGAAAVEIVDKAYAVSGRDVRRATETHPRRQGWRGVVRARSARAAPPEYLARAG